MKPLTPEEKLEHTVFKNTERYLADIVDTYKRTDWLVRGTEKTTQPVVVNAERALTAVRNLLSDYKGVK